MQYGDNKTKSLDNIHIDPGADQAESEANFKVYHDLMQKKVREILLVLSPYDAFILEEDGSLASRVIDEYHGLNLSNPPRMTNVSSGREALQIIQERPFDLVITMPMVVDMDGFTLGREIKALKSALPVVLLTHNLRAGYPLPDHIDLGGIDNFYIWTHDPDLLLALIKNVEDHLNAPADTVAAKVRIILLVEDSPHYLSYFLPFLYKEVVRQTQAVLDETLNQEHRLLKMRARPKILVAKNYEEAENIYLKFRSFIHGVISDTRFSRDGAMDDHGGRRLLSMIRKENPDLPLLLISSDSSNKAAAESIPAVFLDKNSHGLTGELHQFFLNHLGFGDFVFKMPGGKVLGSAGSLYSFEKMIADIPDESLAYHAERSHFSNWIMARAEVSMASRLREVRVSDFATIEEMRRYLVSSINSLRRFRQQGVVAGYSAHEFDSEIMDFVTIGKGTMGGKALGLAFMLSRLRLKCLKCQGEGLRVRIPRTFVITTGNFDDFVEKNNLRCFRDNDIDHEIAIAFRQAALPDELVKNLSDILDRINFPLTVRSSSTMEDSHFRPFAGLYATYMLPNNHPDHQVRLKQLSDAVKLVYASAYFSGPKAFAQSARLPGKDGMGIIIQELVGKVHGDYFYPAVSGVAMSQNYYPVGKMNPEDGVVQIALGFGKTVVEGEKSLRFSPRYPGLLPQFSTVDDILENSQRFFYALDMKESEEIGMRDSNLVRREIVTAGEERPVLLLSSTYSPEEHRIRDNQGKGLKVLTFAALLKFDDTLPRALDELLEDGRRGMGCAVEIEFAAELNDQGVPEEICFLQIRPMVTGSESFDVDITEEEISRAFCVSGQALGHGKTENIADIIVVKPERFAPGKTREIAKEIGELNRILTGSERPYLLIGPGRWGSNDPLLGIPVRWADISGVGAMIELRNETLKVDPSQGTHFFQNITSLGICYVTVTEGKDRLDWDWLSHLETIQETKFLRQVRLEEPFVMKLNGRESRCVMYLNRRA
ncbi:MAG: phosphoenolpyruvate synthase/pyruvate phosphate dikinase [Proteobacteria bacterium]|nr:phosphoenolpyruvate synthase/pyruvate phosphate dikinase [Pseudomonadota bacterium]MBU1739010.1 phosphoenolpyruvate synthase/pyruvate phosphate dikinase [Pseudomonadota bacterium]